MPTVQITTTPLEKRFKGVSVYVERAVYADQPSDRQSLKAKVLMGGRAVKEIYEADIIAVHQGLTVIDATILRSKAWIVSYNYIEDRYKELSTTSMQWYENQCRPKAGKTSALFPEASPRSSVDVKVARVNNELSSNTARSQHSDADEVSTMRGSMELPEPVPSRFQRSNQATSNRRASRRVSKPPTKEVALIPCDEKVPTFAKW
ncbi:hypothetical protein AURDEDRAFT_165520 [Auricularia subglabra TFB-10046 SS5]|nr:hypothetical protein AURDEDRAFT_165520 [Auricularia subglabra TFB-10046 SS5]